MPEDWVSQSTLDELINENRYKVQDSTKFLSRCIDGRYTSDNLEPLAIPGADAGETAIMMATARQYALEVNFDRVVELFIKFMGGAKNVRLHTDSHGDCRHMSLVAANPEAYGLVPEDILWIRAKSEWALSNGAIEKTLKTDHLEQAILIVKTANFSIYPALGNRQVFVFHKGLIDARHKAICKEVVQNKAVILPEGCDEEYLYEIVSEVTEDHFMETINRKAQGLPIYEVSFKNDGSFLLESLGKVA